MKIVLASNPKLQWILIGAFMLPSTVGLFFPYGLWIFVGLLVMCARMGWQFSERQVMLRCPTSLVCLILPTRVDMPWIVVFRSGFTQCCTSGQIISIGHLLWVKIGPHACFISPRQVTPEQWSALHLLKEQGLKPCPLALPTSEDIPAHNEDLDFHDDPARRSRLND